MAEVAHTNQAAQAGEEHEAQSGGEYIRHHLSFLTFGRHPEGYPEAGTLGFAHTAEEGEAMGFWSVHVDTLGMSILLGALFLGLFAKVASSATAGVPSGLQNAVELVIEFVHSNVSGTYQGKSAFIAPLALTIFTWVLLMNTIDLVPVDWIPLLAQTISGDHHTFFKAVPTTDVNITLGMSLTVFLLIIIYSVRMKGLGGFLGELAFHPFGKLGLPLNLAIELPAFFAKPLSLALRLFGNLYAGEVIFLVISLMGGLQWMLAIWWAIFHILVVPLQAYLFMMLTVVYLNQASQHH